MRTVLQATAALLITASASQAQAGPIAVIDAANLAQTAHDERVLAEAARIKARQQTAKKN